MEDTRTITSLLLVQSPEKLSYLVGNETLNLDGGQICAVYDDGTYETLAMDEPNVTATFDSSKAGPALAKVCYKNKEVLFQIQVKEPVICRFHVTSKPNKQVYLAGEKLDLTGLELLAEYEDGKKVPWPEIPEVDYAVEMGDVVYTLNIKGISIPIFIKVLAAKIVGIKMGKLPQKREYLERVETLNVSGATVIKLYDSGKQEEVDLKLSMVHGFSNLQPGTQILTVQIGPYQTSFEVRIRQKSAKSIAVLNEPIKMVYIEGEPIEMDGLKLMVEYDNGESRVIDKESTSEQENEGAFYTYKPKVATLDTLAVLVYVGTASTQVPISVTPRQLTDIKVFKNPNKIKYLERKEQLDVEGMELACSYNFGEDRIIPVTEDMVFGFDNRFAGECHLEVQYNGFITQFSVEIIPATLLGIIVDKMPDRTTYAPGEMFDKTGMLVSGFYSNGLMQPINSYLITPDRPLTTDDIAIVVTNLNKSAIVPIQVQEKYEEESNLAPKEEPVPDTIDSSINLADKPSATVMPKQGTENKKHKRPGLFTRTFYPSTSHMRGFDD